MIQGVTTVKEERIKNNKQTCKAIEKRHAQKRRHVERVRWKNSGEMYHDQGRAIKNIVRRANKGSCGDTCRGQID